MLLEFDHINLELSPFKCVFWEATKTLICADIHIGKSGHFRSNGIAMPSLINKNNFWNLAVVFEKFSPTTLIVLGDMVHSKENHEWDDFSDFLDNYPELKRVLIRGNHELYDNAIYKKMGFDVFDRLQINQLLLTHEPEENVPIGHVNLCGHVHPAIRLSGTAGQNLRLPCFWIKKNQMVLPAFGTFTGMFAIRPRRGDRIVVVADDKLVEIGKEVTA